MEDFYKNLLFGFILFSVFGMLILTATIEVAGNYDKDTSEVIGGSLSLDKFNDSISGIEDSAKSLRTTFGTSNIFSIIAGVVVEGIFGIALDMIDLILAPVDILFDIMVDVFGVPTWITSVLLGIIIMAIIFGIWRLIRIGD